MSTIDTITTPTTKTTPRTRSRVERTRPDSGPSGSMPTLTAQHLLQLPALRELVHELVEVADLLHERILDRLDPHPADHAGDAPCVGVQTRPGKELLEGRAGGEVPAQL
jgi:hypothetical protein